MPKHRIASPDDWMREWRELAEIGDPEATRQLARAATIILGAPELYSEKALTWARDSLVTYMMED
jgi:hypothetical protein